MLVSDFDFTLPPGLIADRPVEPRDAARLLCWTPENGISTARHTVHDLPDLLRPGDLMIFNDTRVIPARLHGVRRRGAAELSVEILLVKAMGDGLWSAMARPARRLRPGDELLFPGDVTARVEARGQDMDGVRLRFSLPDDALLAALERVGAMPLPPYIVAQRPADTRDQTDYQTMFASRSGAIAAPTAGLHFTPRLIEALARRGIGQAMVTLHVGPGTFLPVKAERVEDHRMHAEWGQLGEATATAMAATRAAGGRVIAVGTTSLRLLETAARQAGAAQPWQGETDIFMTPGFQFRAADALMTNFHLPRSTLLMLVAAFIGLEAQRAVYAHAVAAGYRFYSYGDASLLFRAAS